MDVVYIEYSQLTEFPSVVLELNPYFMSIVGNDIRDIPSLQLSPEANPLVRFTLSENPIEKLPETMNVTINILSLDGTRIKDLPSWVYTQVRQLVYLPGTPFCVAQRNGGAPTTVASTSGPQIYCVDTDESLMTIGRYPHRVMDTYRAL
ncbi:hypothetical protein PINS_up012512 [Pythium insidiosum]|nr:hypothetical protein PINS_up012512 [Pythium insidiosum]